MYTKKGNGRVTGLMHHLVQAREAGVAEDQLLDQFRKGYAEIDREHPEVTDTTVREAIEEALESNGFSGKFSAVIAHHHPWLDTMQ